VPEPEASSRVTFDTTLSEFGNNTGIVVPDDLMDRLGAGRRPAVVVNINGHEYRSTVGVMGGQHLVSVSAAVRGVTGLVAGDDIHVTLTVAEGPRAVEVPDDLAAALSANEPALAFFGQLSNSLQRFHIDNVNAANAPETRKRRIDRCIELFVAGKKR